MTDKVDKLWLQNQDLCSGESLHSSKGGESELFPNHASTGGCQAPFAAAHLSVINDSGRSIKSMEKKQDLMQQRRKGELPHYSPCVTTS